MTTEPNAPIVPLKHANGQQMGHDAETTHFLECTNAYIGLTKREHFSALAMQALITGVVSAGAYTIADINQGGCCDIAAVAVVCADQLIVELNKPTK